MGTTLDNGIYLPDEGERNCYEGLAGNWVALDNHLGSTNIHVTINDKQAWNGHVADTTIHVTSADKQAWNGHVADATIHVTSADKQAWNGHVADSVKHVTAEDKNKWDAVTSKADDSDVVHKSGNETKSGELTLENDLILKGSTTPVIVTKSKIDLDTSGGNESISWTVKDKTENYNVFEQRLGKLSSQIVDYRLNITARYNNNSYTRGVYLRVDPANQAAYLNPAGNNLLSLGMPSTRYSNIYTNKVNDIEPSSLSLPNPNNSIDISSYITDLTGVNISNYTPSANGYIVITCDSTDVDYIKMSNNLDFVSVVDNTNNQFTSGILGVWQPCVAGIGIQIRIKSSALRTARFIPCQGNI